MGTIGERGASKDKILATAERLRAEKNYRGAVAELQEVDGDWPNYQRSYDDEKELLSGAKRCADAIVLEIEELPESRQHFNRPIANEASLLAKRLQQDLDLLEGKKFYQLRDFRKGPVVAVLGLLGGLFFLSGSMTGNVIGTSAAGNWIGAALFIIGIVAGFVWMRGR